MYGILVSDELTSMKAAVEPAPDGLACGFEQIGR
jgi:hypothetical protein